MGLAESWTTGAISAAILTALATVAFANVMNTVVGLPYLASYDVAKKYITYGKHKCYGLAMTKVDDPVDQFEICVSQSKHEEIVVGDKLEIKGWRSRYVNQLLSYTKR